jgi:hypothetical protein
MKPMDGNNDFQVLLICRPGAGTVSCRVPTCPGNVLEFYKVRKCPGNVLEKILPEKKVNLKPMNKNYACIRKRQL